MVRIQRLGARLPDNLAFASRSLAKFLASLPRDARDARTVGRLTGSVDDLASKARTAQSIVARGGFNRTDVDMLIWWLGHLGGAAELYRTVGVNDHDVPRALSYVERDCTELLKAILRRRNAFPARRTPVDRAA